MTKTGQGGLSVARLKTHYIGQQPAGSTHAALNSVPPVFRHAAETYGANSEKDISKIKAGLVCRLNTLDHGLAVRNRLVTCNSNCAGRLTR
jgi:hypothetical protein